MLATSAVANAGPMPGIASSRLLVSFDRCQAMMRRSNANIWDFNACNWRPSAATQARAHLRQPGVFGIGDNLEQTIDTLSATGAADMFCPPIVRCIIQGRLAGALNIERVHAIKE